MSDRVVVWLAQGLGIGRIPVAPGTFGAIVGIFWSAALLSMHKSMLYAAGCVLGFICSVAVSSRAERVLGQKDPGSVIIDEITAMPACLAAWVGLMASAHGQLPTVGVLMGWRSGLWLLGVFVAFRVFDIAKPWPIRQSQALPGGWGITVDDFLAAVYVNLLTVVAWQFLGH